MFDISQEGGFHLKGRISHNKEDEKQENAYSWYRQSTESIKRSFYIDDTLYTCSDSKLKMNDLATLLDINELSLQA